MNKYIRYIILFILAVIISCLVSSSPDDFLMNTLYTVAGIMFSVGIGLIVTFNISGVRNKQYIKDIRQALNKLRNNHIKCFIVITISFIIDKYLRENEISKLSFSFRENFNLNINFSVFFLVAIIYSIAYFIVNFIGIQKLNDQIFDRINSESEE